MSVHVNNPLGIDGVMPIVPRGKGAIQKPMRDIEGHSGSRGTFEGHKVSTFRAMKGAHSSPAGTKGAMHKDWVLSKCTHL